MAKCKLCKKSGIFKSVSSNGLCQKCEKIALADIPQQLNTINKCMQTINESTNATKISASYNILEQRIRYLHNTYEKNNITTISPPPSHYLEFQLPQYDSHVAYALQREMDTLILKVFRLKTTRGRKNNIDKFKEYYKKHKATMTNSSEIKWLVDTVEEDFERLENVFLS